MTTTDTPTSAYSRQDEGPHPITMDDPDWQESVWYHWYDERAAIGGFHRVGHEIPRGTATFWAGVLTDDGERFRRTESDVSLSDADILANGFGAGPEQRVTATDDGMLVETRTDGLDVTLEFVDLHPMINLFTRGATSVGSLATEYIPNHFEASCRVRGEVRMNGRIHTVDGLGQRDHSWGIRRWQNSALAHRWAAGTFGEELSFAAATWLTGDGQLARVGYVVEHGEPTWAESVDVMVRMLPDGFSHRGGEVTFSLPGGREVNLDAQLIGAIPFGHRSYYLGLEHLCRVTSGDLTGGMCDLSAIDNARAGTSTPVLCLNAVNEDGFHRDPRP